MGSRGISALLCGVLAAYLLLSPAYAVYNFEEYASSMPQRIRYVLVPAALALIFLAVGLFAHPKVGMTAGLYGLSVLAGFFLFETLLTLRSIPVRLSMLGQLSYTQEEAIAHEGDVVRGFTLAQLNRMSGVKELNKAVLSGFPRSQVVLCTAPDHVVSYRADRYGFNNPDALYEGGPMDAMLLGDSFVEGFCLPPGEDMVSQLRRDDIAAVGVGIRGNGPLTELATLGRYGPMLKPRHVLMVFFEGNDWKNLERELKLPWLRATLGAEVDFGTPVSAGDAMRRAASAMSEFSRRPVTMVDLVTRTEMLRNFLALQQTFTRLGLNYPKAAPDIPEFRHILRRAKVMVGTWGGSFTLVYVPRVDRFMGALASDAAFEPLHALVVDGAKREGVPVVDLSLAFKKQSRPRDLYAADGHFSSSGAAFAAKIVARHLREGAIASAAADPAR